MYSIQLGTVDHILALLETKLHTANSFTSEMKRHGFHAESFALYRSLIEHRPDFERFFNVEELAKSSLDDYALGGYSRRPANIVGDLVAAYFADPQLVNVRYLLAVQKYGDAPAELVAKGNVRQERIIQALLLTTRTALSPSFPTRSRITREREEWWRACRR